MRPALAAALLLCGCHDFDAGIRQCMSNGVCKSNVETDGGAHFAVSLTPNTLTLGPGGMALVHLDLTRPIHTQDVLTLSIDGPPGVTVGFERDTGYFNDNTLAVTLPLPFAAGTYALDVIASKNGTQVARSSLSVTVTAPALTLLVDDDLSPNNLGTPFVPVSAEDTFFPQALGGTAFDHFHLIAPWDGGVRSPLSVEQLKPYARIVWYTGASYGPTVNLTAADQGALSDWLDLGAKNLLLSSQNYVRDHGQPWKGSVNPFYRSCIGGDGGVWVRGGPRVVTGVAGQPTSGLVLTVQDGGPINNDFGLVSLRAGTEALFTVVADPDDAGLRDVAVATRRTNVGDAGTSVCVYVGFPLIDALDGDGGTRRQAFDALRTAAGL